MKRRTSLVKGPQQDSSSLTVESDDGLRLAMQLSADLASKDALQDEEERQLAVATIASLSPPLHSHAESLSFKFWNTGRLDVEDRLSDCFYVIHGSYQKDLKSPHEFADIASLRSLPAGEDGDLREVVIFDNDQDDELLVIQEAAAEAMTSAVYEGPEACVAALSAVVSEHMGGTATTPQAQDELSRRWERSSAAIKQRRGRPVVLVAQLEAAGPAHRALLFKFLADACNVPCSLVGRRCKDGRDAEATALLRIGGRLREVDLVAQPGRLTRWPHGSSSGSLRGSSADLHAQDLIAEGAPTLNEISKTESSEWRCDLQTLPIQAAASAQPPVAQSQPPQSSKTLPLSLREPQSELSGRFISSEAALDAISSATASHPAHPTDQVRHHPQVSTHDMAAAAWSRPKRGSSGTSPQEDSNPTKGITQSGKSPLPCKRYSTDSRRALAAAARGSARASGSNAVTSSFTSPLSSSFTAAGPSLGSASSAASNLVERSARSLSNVSWAARAEAAALAEQSLPPLLRNRAKGFSDKPAHRMHVASYGNAHGAKSANQPGPMQLEIISSLSRDLPDQPLREDDEEQHPESSQIQRESPSMIPNVFSGAITSAMHLIQPFQKQQQQQQQQQLPAVSPASQGAGHQTEPDRPGSGSDSGSRLDLPQGQSVARPSDQSLSAAALSLRGTGHAVLARDSQAEARVASPTASISQGAVLPPTTSTNSQPGTTSPASLRSTKTSLASTEGEILHSFSRTAQGRHLMAASDDGPMQQQQQTAGPSPANTSRHPAANAAPLGTSGVISTQSQTLAAQRQHEQRRQMRATTMGDVDSATEALIQQSGSRRAPFSSSHSILTRSRSADDLQTLHQPSQPLGPLQNGFLAPQSSMHTRQVPGDDDDDCEIDASELLMGPRIGIGSFGEVYRGSWRHTDVAVKRLLDQDVQDTVVQEFRREVAIMKKLRHPCIVQFLGACTKLPHLCIVSAFVARGSLFRLLHRSKTPVQIDEKRRLLMALDIARGMHYLHSCRPPIVHCDLKTPNLLVDKDFTIKVADFGLSRARWTAWIASSSRTGTPEWCAPEVLRSERTDEKSDVWSFGVVLWELATGLEPWAEQSPVQVVGAVGFGGATLEIPSSTNPGLTAIIRSCWQEPKLRPSFGELITSIRDLASSRGFMGPQSVDGSGPQLQPLALSQQHPAEGAHSPPALLIRQPSDRQQIPADGSFLRRAFASQDRIAGKAGAAASPQQRQQSPTNARFTALQSPARQDEGNAAESQTPRAAALAGNAGRDSTGNSDHEAVAHLLSQPRTDVPSGNAASTPQSTPLPASQRQRHSQDGFERSPGRSHVPGTWISDSGHFPGTPLMTSASLSPEHLRASPAIYYPNFARTVSVPTESPRDQEPSARRLAAQAARVASNKISRGLSHGFKELANGIQTARNTFVGSSASTSRAGTRTTSVQDTTQHPSDAQMADSGSGIACGPFSGWLSLGPRRPSEASTAMEQLQPMSSSEPEPVQSNRSSISTVSRRGSEALPPDGFAANFASK